jgi:hypothetical protein
VAALAVPTRVPVVPVAVVPVDIVQMLREKTPVADYLAKHQSL